MLGVGVDEFDLLFAESSVVDEALK